jgi:hypothetical protein
LSKSMKTAMFKRSWWAKTIPSLICDRCRGSSDHQRPAGAGPLFAAVELTASGEASGALYF